MRPARLTRAGVTAVQALTLIAFGLRVHQLPDRGLWFDEAITYFRSTGLLGAPLPEVAPAYQARHVLWDALIAPWSSSIPHELGLRWVAFLAGVLMVPVMFRVGARLGGERAGLLAALLLSVSPAHLHHAQEARQYTLVMLVAFVALWALLLAEDRTQWGRWAFPLSATLVTALHAISGLWAMTLIGYAGLRAVQTKRRDLAISAGVALVGVLGVAGVIFLIESRAPFLGWMTPPPVTMLFSIVSLGVGVLSLAGPELGTWWAAAAYQGARLLLVIWAVVVMLQVGRWSHRDHQRRLLVLVLAGGPPLALMAASYLFQPLIAQRYLLPSIGAITLALALALDWTASGARRWRPAGPLAPNGAQAASRPNGAPVVVALVLTALLIATGLGQGWAYFTDARWARPAWRTVYTHIAEEAAPGDVVLSAEPLIGVYYARTLDLPVAVRPMPPDRAELLNSPTRLWIIQPQSDRPYAALRPHTELAGMRLYLIEAGAGGDDPETSTRSD